MSKPFSEIAWKEQVMPDAKYLIVGGGMAADAAVRGIRDIDAEGSIALIGAEADPPYKRPPLSKGLWNGTPFEKVWTDTADLNVELHLGRSAKWLDPRDRCVVDDRGVAYRYDKLLLATGVTPRRLPFGDDRVIAFRTLHDYRRLRALAGWGQRFAVIGGGFIGSEIAAALAAQGKEVTLIFPEGAIGSRLFPRDLALSLNDVYRAQGVQVLEGESVVGFETRGDQSLLRLRSLDHPIERVLIVDGIVAGIGSQPNLEPAQAAGLAVGDGILVDRFLRTSHPDIYAAGDVANVALAPFGERRRVEHEDNAKVMGRLAGRAMAGQSEPYDHIPFFYSDLFDLGYEAVGEIDSRLQTVAAWTEPYREGVVYYLRDDRVRGVLLWNVWDQVDAARAVIRAAETVGLNGQPLSPAVA
jgi:NADPH-dependent 2,4-dienoyl-CoA reductase/sulfur reductase-like enzyme